MYTVFVVCYKYKEENIIDTDVDSGDDKVADKEHVLVLFQFLKYHKPDKVGT